VPRNPYDAAPGYDPRLSIEDNVRAITRYLGTWQANDLAMLYDPLPPGYELRSPLHQLTPPTVPGAPSMPTRATAIAGYRQVVVCWDREPNPYITAYEVQRSTGGAAFATVATATTNCYVDDQLTPSTAYNYRVRALLRDVTPGAWSDVATATTAADDSGMLTTYRTALDRLQERLINTTAGPIHAGLPFDVADYGATGDGVTDDTVAIQATIDAAHASGGGWITFSRPGTYMATQLVLSSDTLLDGGTFGAVTLKQIVGSNRDFIISENFATLTGTSGPTVVVPHHFGLRNLIIDGNKAGNSSGRGIAWCGNGQMMLGVVAVQYCAGDNIHTECPSSYLQATPPTVHDMIEGFYETVISICSNGRGWYFIGPSDSRILDYIGYIDATADWGFYNANTATSSGSIDHFGCLQVYSDDANATTRHKGIYLGSPAYINVLYSNAVGTTIDGGGAINQFHVDFVGYQHHWVGLTVNAHRQFIGNLGASIAASATGGDTCVTWPGSSGTCGALYVYDTSGQANNIGLQDLGAGINAFLQCNVQQFTGTGSIGIKGGATGSIYRGLMVSNAIGFEYTVAGGYVSVDLVVYTAAGQVPIAGGTPQATDHFDVRGLGSVTGGTRTHVVATDVVDLNLTVPQGFNIPHGCLYTPAERNVMLNLTMTPGGIYDWTLDLPPTLLGISSTNLGVVVKLRTASATVGAKGSIVAQIWMGA